MNKRNIYLLYAMALLHGMVFYAPVATLYRQAAGLGIFQITLIESISLALTIALEIPWGWLADRLGYRRTMIVCCGLYFVSKWIFWQAKGFGDFLLERVLLGIVCAGLSGVDSSMLYLSCGGKDVHRAFSIYQYLEDLGMLAAAAVFALWIGENYRLAACLTAVSYGFAAVLAWGLQDEKNFSDRKKKAHIGMGRLLRLQLGNRKLVCLVLAAALLGQTHQSITVFLNQVKYASVNMGHGEIAFAYLAVSLAGLAGGYSARLREMLGAKRMGSSLLLLGFVCCLILIGAGKPWISVVAVLGLRVCFSLFQPLYQILQNQMITVSDRATALSIHAVVYNGLGIFLNLLLGYAAQLDLAASFAVGAGFCLLGWLLFVGNG